MLGVTGRGRRDDRPRLVRAAVDLRQAKDLMAGRPMRPAPSVAERFAVALDHARMVRAYEADAAGAALEFRKHLGWYAKGLPSSADLRADCTRSSRSTRSRGSSATIWTGWPGRSRRRRADARRDVPADPEPVDPCCAVETAAA
jgi:hypothetical protein